MDIFAMRKKQQEEVLKVAKELPKVEDERWSGLFGDSWSCNNPPGFAGHAAFLLDDPEKDEKTASGNRRPDKQIVVVPHRVDERGKPVKLTPMDSHGYIIAKLWTHSGKAGDRKANGELVKKDYLFMAGDIIDYHDPDSLEEIQSGTPFNSFEIKKIKVRINLITPEKELALLAAGKQVPNAFVWVAGKPSEKSLAEAAAAQAEEQQGLAEVPEGVSSEVPF